MRFDMQSYAINIIQIIVTAITLYGEIQHG